MGLANFAMLRTGCEIRKGCELIANTLRNSQWLRTDCQLFAKILFCCSSIPLVMSSTASHFFHFSFVFPLIFGLVDG